MRFPVYLRDDQWLLVDDLLREAATIMAKEADVGQHLMIQLKPPSRVGLRWCDSRVAEIRAEIARRRANKNQSEKEPR